jgi:hypothetical protein
MLTDETIRRHLEGEITIGLYAINPSSQRCEWVAIDADYGNVRDYGTKPDKSQARLLTVLQLPPEPFKCMDEPNQFGIRREEQAMNGAAVVLLLPYSSSLFFALRFTSIDRCCYCSYTKGLALVDIDLTSS